MGVLEDAIREHLDLKRRHGASDEELTQQEAEALGSARRDLPEDAETADGAEADEAAEAVPAVEPEPPVEPVPVEPAPPGSEPPAPVDQDTAIYSPGDAPVPPEQDADPDFGEAAPEQKPRRDFDFD